MISFDVLIAFAFGIILLPVFKAMHKIVYVLTSGNKWLDQMEIKLAQEKMTHKEAIARFRQTNIDLKDQNEMLQQTVQDLEADNRKLLEGIERFTSRLESAERKLGR